MISLGNPPDMWMKLNVTLTEIPFFFKNSVKGLNVTIPDSTLLQIEKILRDGCSEERQHIVVCVIFKGCFSFITSYCAIFYLPWLGLEIRDLI